MRIDAAMIVVVAVVAGVRDGEADCRKTCQSGEVRDGRGCCVAAPTAKPTKGKKPPKGSRSKLRSRGAPRLTTVTPTVPAEAAVDRQHAGAGDAGHGRCLGERAVRDVAIVRGLHPAGLVGRRRHEAPRLLHHVRATAGREGDDHRAGEPQRPR